MTVITYPITSQLQNDQVVVVRAEKGEDHIELVLPFDGTEVHVACVVTGVRLKPGDGNLFEDGYLLEFHTHDEHGCCGDNHIFVTKKMLLEWTGLLQDDIDEAFHGVGRTYTMNLLRKLPVQLNVQSGEVQIVLSSEERVHDVCETLLKSATGAENRS